MTQYELPPQAQLQQSAAHRVSGEELETYGKSAAASFQSGGAESLNDAVVQTIKQAGLSPEQVRRVVEFANTHAFITEFKKEGESTKYVHFEHGPANPFEVIQDLNDGGGGTVFDRGNFDYSQEPSSVKKASANGLYAQNLRSLEKLASAPLEALPQELRKLAAEDLLLAEAFQAKPVLMPYENPLQDVEEALYKLATVRDAANAEVSELEVALLDINQDLYNQVKQAAMAGVPLGHIIQAWHDALQPPAELVKSAFSLIGPRLYKEGIFTAEGLGESLEKTAGSKVVNENHPLITTFGAYCEGVIKVAELRAVRDEANEGVTKLQHFRKMATDHVKQTERCVEVR